MSRKNYRGFVPHVWRLLEEIIQKEFLNTRRRIEKRQFVAPEKGWKLKEWLDISFGTIGGEDCGFETRKDTWGRILNSALAICDLHGIKEKDCFCITLILSEEWLKMNDEEIKDVLRHEVLHFDLGKGDSDIEFVKEALLRGIRLNDISFWIFYAYKISEEYRFNKSLFEGIFYEGFNYWATLVPVITNKNKEIDVGLENGVTKTSPKFHPTRL